jgi:aryl-alcohol dehydrogenase-like predicted oxidoreductase
MAMSILASGAIPASEAFAYASRFPAVKSLLFGASRPETLDKSLGIIRSLDSRFAL